MAVSQLQNFFKTKIKVECGAGTGNIYLDVKPTPTNGWLVISPGSESLREIIRYTGTGTDGTGDYVTIANIADRGLGGTTAQSHAIGEAVRMNYTAQHQQEIDDTIEAIVAGGTPDASTTVKGRTRLSVAPASATEPIAVGTNDPRLNATTGLTADQQNALAGGGDFGTPSASNKFITETFLTGRTVRYQYDLAGSPHTWTKKAGLKYIVVEGWGGGGNGGGGGSATRCSPGGGGAYVKRIFDASQLGTTELVTVGAAAANSTFGSLLTAFRGGNGTVEGSNSVSGGSGGGELSAGSNGADLDYLEPGSPGYPSAGYGTKLSLTPSGVQGLPPIHHGTTGGGGGVTNGVGGNSIYGGAGGGGRSGANFAGGVSVYGGNGGAGNGSGAGAAGSVPGGGGGAGSTSGGPGGAGHVIVTEYYS